MKAAPRIITVTCELALNMLMFNEFMLSWAHKSQIGNLFCQKRAGNFQSADDIIQSARLLTCLRLLPFLFTKIDSNMLWNETNVGKLKRDLLKGYDIHTRPENHRVATKCDISMTVM